jgi:hypothetical protein
MAARTTYKKPWNVRRNERIAKLSLAGLSQKAIAKKFGITSTNVSQIIYRMGGIAAITETFKETQPVISHTDTLPLDAADLSAGLRLANDQLAKIFIRLALDLEEDMKYAGKPEDKFKYLKIIGPIVKNQVKKMRPSRVNFYIGQGSTAEELERRLLDYAEESRQR